MKISDLQSQFYREADGFRQQQIQRELQKSVYEQDLNKENLDKARALLQETLYLGRSAASGSL